MIPGDPDVLEDAASALEGADTDYADTAAAVSRHGEHVTADWTGSASEAAGGAIATLATSIGVGAVVCAGAAGVLRTYAGALRTAQGRWQEASGRSDAADRAGQDAGRAQDAAHALPDGPGKQAAIDAANSSAATAQAHGLAASGDMQAAEAAAQQADETASRGLRPLLELVATMKAPPGGSPAAASERPARHSTPWWDSAWHGVEHAVGDAWQATGDVLRTSGAEAAEIMADQTQVALGALMVAGGAAGEAAGGALDATVVGSVAGIPLNVAAAGLIVAGVGVAGDGIVRTVHDESTQSQEAPLDDEAATGDDTAGASAGGHPAPNLSEVDPPETSTSPRADLYQGYDPYQGLTKQEFNDKYWDPNADEGAGGWRYPGDNGFAPHTRTPNRLQPGDSIDRFGSTDGKYASPPDTPFAERALPPSSVEYQYGSYEVIKPLPPEVEEGVVAPAFGQEGGGVQYYFPKGLQYYLDHGYLERDGG